MASTNVRVRFAPSPTGFMHLGNVRAALINFLFARQKQGTFIIRIEDTDAQRNTDHRGTQILADLAWLGITYQEGPDIGGPSAPYLQSERTDLYTQYLQKLQEKKMVYRCFCTTEELDKKRERQIALKMPPRYDRHCFKLEQATIEQNLANNVPFIWRFALQHEDCVVQDLARGTIDYNLKNFSDFPLTRQDGSFTFVFANFVDDLTMHITHIFRGEEHISSTALQAALYTTFGKPIPIFWHFPIICNAEGKKLSKRDFGFSLNDLRNEGFLPEAIVNYLAILGASFEQEIMSLEELAATVDFEKSASAGFIRYDVEKLRWINHKWLQLLPTEEIAKRCQPFLTARYPQAAELSLLEIAHLIKTVQEELTTLSDCVNALQFYFEKPTMAPELLAPYDAELYRPLIKQIIKDNTVVENGNDFFNAIVLASKEFTIKPKELYALLRIALTGKPHGISIKSLLELLPHEESLTRLEKLL